MSEAFACGGEDVGGLLYFMLLVAWSLSVLDKRSLLFLANFVKLFLGFFELSQVTAKEDSGEIKAFLISSYMTCKS